MNPAVSFASPIGISSRHQVTFGLPQTLPPASWTAPPTNTAAVRRHQEEICIAGARYVEWLKVIKIFDCKLIGNACFMNRLIPHSNQLNYSCRLTKLGFGFSNLLISCCSHFVKTNLKPPCQRILIKQVFILLSSVSVHSISN